MTTITLPRATVEQALEALHEIGWSNDTRWQSDRAATVIPALRAALAQQAEPVQEPVAWMVYTEGGTSAYVTDNPNDLVGAYRALPLYTAPPQQAEPVQAKFDEVAVEQWKLRMVFYDENGEPLMSRQPEPDEIRAALAQQAEPVGVVSSGVKGGVIWHRWPDQMPDGTKLYAAPHQRKPLTDEKISDLWCEVSGTDFVTADTHVFARAVEVAHGIGRQSDPQIEDRLARHGIPKP